MTGKPPAQGAFLSGILGNLHRDAIMRGEADREMSVAWVLVPILPYLVTGLFYVSIIIFALGFQPVSNSTSSIVSSGFVFALVGLFLLLGILWILIGVLNAVMVYKLVKRRNTHFARQQLIYEDLYNTAREISSRKAAADVMIPFNNLTRTIHESRMEEAEKSAIVWGILAFIPVFGTITDWYVYYFLMRDFYRHERREDAYFQDLTGILASSGININLPRRIFPIPDRSFILYLILSWITLGLFGIYWIYVLLTDPNNHFRQQWMVEDTLIVQASPTLGGPSVPPPSTPPPILSSSSTNYTGPPPQ